MAIPKTRSELLAQLEGSYGKLRDELDAAGPRAGSRVCVDDWTIREMLAVRLWWSDRVVTWIEAGREGEVPPTPAAGYRWKDTPALNAEIVRCARRASYRGVRTGLDRAYERVVAMVGQLTDRELLQVGVFDWAGKYPVCRWISLNTARQYVTARTYMRRALRA